MNTQAIRILQQILASDGYYHGPVSGVRDAPTDAGVDRMIAARAGELS